MRILYLSLIGAVLFCNTVFANRDSIGVKNIGGKMYVQHKVAKGEGLYGIGKRYGTTVADIQQADANTKNGISPGQVILVPYSKPSKNASNQQKTAPKKETPKEQPKKQVNKPETKTEKSPVYHTVTKGETLYRVAVNHKVQVADVSKWNNLKNNEISVGQKLIVGYTTKQVPVVKEDNMVLPDGSKKDEKTVLNNDPNPKKENTDKPKKGDYIDKKYQDQLDEAEKKQAENKKGKTVWKEIKESGVASWIDDGSIVSEKKLALHKTAPVGTVIQLKNPMNNEMVFVKVIGKLPKDETEENVVIKITKSTADKLGLRDKYFRVDMSYGMEVSK